MPFTTVAKNRMINHVDVDTISLHDGFPGESGDNEINGGNPAYARLAVNWTTSTTGSISTTAIRRFNIPSGVTLTHIGFWRGGVFYAYEPIDNVEYEAQGTYDVDSAVLAITD